MSLRERAVREHNIMLEEAELEAARARQENYQRTLAASQVALAKVLAGWGVEAAQLYGHKVAGTHDGAAVAIVEGIAFTNYQNVTYAIRQRPDCKYPALGEWRIITNLTDLGHYIKRGDL